MTKIHLQSTYSDIVSDGGLDPRNEYEKKFKQMPLTDEQIYECYRAEFDIMLTDSGAQNTIKKFARAIERAHGIGVKDDN